MGGTNTVVGIVNKRGEIIARGSIETSKHARIEDYINELSALIHSLTEESGTKGQIKGIGVGAPSSNYHTGCIENAANLRWKGEIPFAKLLSEQTHLPVTLANDANAAAIGEMMYGAARGMKDFIVMTLGTGVGSGIVANGQLIVGHDSFAGELGHITIRRENGRPCGCGKSGCLETYSSATGVVRTAREFLETRTDNSLLRNIPIEQMTSKDIFDAAMTGDKMAKEVFEKTGEILGEAFADFVAFSSPEAIILFGGLSKAGDLILKPIRESMEKNMVFLYKGKVKLLRSELNESDAAVLGASALGWEARQIEQLTIC